MAVWAMYHNAVVIKCRRSAGLQTGNKTSGHYGNVQFGKLRAWREFLAVQLVSAMLLRVLGKL